MAVTDRHSDTHRRLQELEGELQAELRRWAQVLRHELDELKIRHAADPETLFRAIDALTSRHHEAIQAKVQAIEKIAASELLELPIETIRVGVDYDVMPHRRGPNRRRKPRRRPDAGGVLADPKRPNDLSGGAAASLSFDD